MRAFAALLFGVCCGHLVGVLLLLSGCAGPERKIQITCTDPDGDVRQATMAEATFTRQSFDRHMDAICAVQVAP